MTTAQISSFVAASGHTKPHVSQNACLITSRPLIGRDAEDVFAFQAAIILKATPLTPELRGNKAVIQREGQGSAITVAIWGYMGRLPRATNCDGTEDCVCNGTFGVGRYMPITMTSAPLAMLSR